MTRQDALDFLLTRPAEFGRLVGFEKLGDLHNGWIVEFVRGKNDITKQAARNTYKTTSVSVAIALLMILLPNKRILFMRKTDTDVKEVIRQVNKILTAPQTLYFVSVIYGVSLRITSSSMTEISTNLMTDRKGTSQLVGMGIGSSITGKHFDVIFTDDIVNINDRFSRSERERTKIVYQELQNVKNRGGRIINTGTPWHPEDAFSLMPKPEKYDCYHPEIRKIISAEKLAEIKDSMLPSLFAANYELRHIASENVIFTNPKMYDDEAIIENGIMHVDAAYYGEDYTAWGIMRKADGKYYLFGKCRRKHIDDCADEIVADYLDKLAQKSYIEDNADKGFVARDLRKRGMKVVTYHENVNKNLKIVTFLKKIWKDLYFVPGTDPEYIAQICDYFEDAEHDDAPDDAACLARLLLNKKDRSDL